MQDAPSLINLQNALAFVNLLSLPHLSARKTRREKPLVNYNQSHVVTLIEYSNILRQQALDKKIAKEIRQQKWKEKGGQEG